MQNYCIRDLLIVIIIVFFVLFCFYTLQKIFRTMYKYVLFHRWINTLVFFYEFNDSLFFIFLLIFESQKKSKILLSLLFSGIFEKYYLALSKVLPKLKWEDNYSSSYCNFYYFEPLHYNGLFLMYQNGKDY